MCATVLLAGGLWGVDELTATNPTASATSSVHTSAGTAQRSTTTYDDDGSESDDSSSSSGSSTTFTPSVSHADTSSHAS